MAGEAYEGWADYEWRPVPGFEGVYEVCNIGAVRRVGKAARTGKGRGGGARIGHILMPRVVPGGYLAVQLWRDGKPHAFLLHVLVASAFIGPCPVGKEVNHRDGVKSNNSHENLEYLTRSENIKHAYQTGLMRQRTGSTANARRKPRSMVACACGCGTVIETPDRKGRSRRFVAGHNMRSAA